MKRIIAFLLLFSLAFSFSACTRGESATDVTCEEIIAAYESAGYTLGYHLHEDPVYLQDGICCCLMFQDPAAPNKNDIYINRYNNAEDAQSAAQEKKCNIVLWLFCCIYGETRWLKSEQFGTLHCMTYEKKMLVPLRELVR